jgi:hypothetical protein
MELGVNVACVTHASRVRALLVWRPERFCGNWTVVDVGDALVGSLGEVGNKWRLQQVTIEEHQVGDLVFALLPLFIHIAEGHIDLTIIQ